MGVYKNPHGQPVVLESVQEAKTFLARIEEQGIESINAVTSVEGNRVSQEASVDVIMGDLKDGDLLMVGRDNNVTFIRPIAGLPVKKAVNIKKVTAQELFDAADPQKIREKELQGRKESWKEIQEWANSDLTAQGLGVRGLTKLPGNMRYEVVVDKESLGYLAPTAEHLAGMLFDRVHDAYDTMAWTGGGISYKNFGVTVENVTEEGAEVKAVLQLNLEPYENLSGEGDAAMAKPDFTRGGINLNSASLDMQIRRDGNGVPLPVSQQNLDNIKIDGLVPVILDIKPALSMPLFSEAATAAPSTV